MQMIGRSTLGVKVCVNHHPESVYPTNLFQNILQHSILKNIGKIIILFKVTIIIKCSRLACVWSFQLGTCVFANSPQIAQSNMFCHKTPTGSCPSTTWWHLVSHKLSHLVKNFQRLTMIRTIKNQHIGESTLHLFLRSLFLSSDMRWF